MQTKELLRKVTEKCTALCEENGLTLWDVTFEKEGKGYFLSVFIDRAEGVFIGDCETISRGLDPFLDEKQFDSLPSYTLSVSSAGLERRLVKPAHFEWAKGREVDVSFYKAQNGAQSVSGVLEGKTEAGIVLIQNGNQVTLEDGDIAAVRLRFQV